MAGRVVDLDATAPAERAARLFEGEVLGVRRLAVPGGGTLRVETAPGEERVLVAVAGRGRCRSDAFDDDSPGQVFEPGRIGLLRAGEWCEVTADKADDLVIVEVRGPEPERRA